MRLGKEETSDMKKKVLALLSAVTIMAMGSMTVSAASPTVGTTETAVSTQTAVTAVEGVETPAEYLADTTVAEGFKVEAVSDTTVKSTQVAVQNLLLNDVASLGNKLGNSRLVAAATDSTSKVTATILSVVDVDPTTATKNESGKYVVTLKISDIAANDTIVILHYNGSAWETIVPAKVEAGAVTFETASLSPIGTVKLAVNGVSTSPKTGEVAPIAALIILAGVAGAAVCGKKYFA